MSAFYFVLLLGPLIFFHEFGHFIVARLFKVRVLEFSIGFGPTLGSFRLGETTWRVAVLPLGGYVKMLGHDPMDEVPDTTEGSFATKALWQRALIVFAGPFFNLLLPLFIFFFGFLGHDRVNPAIIGTLQPEGIAAQAGLLPGDVIKTVNDEPVDGWWELSQLIGDHGGEALEVVVERAGVDLPAVTLTPRLVTETIAPELGLTREVGRIEVEITYRRPILSVRPGGAADASGLRSWDRVIAIDGEAVDRWDVVSRRLNEAKRPLSLTVLREVPLQDVRAGLGGLVFSRLAPPLELRFDPSLGDGTTGVDSAEFYVRDVTPGSPEALAGLRRGDKIISINGRQLSSWPFFKKLVVSEPDRSHRIVFERAGALQPPVDITFERRKFKGEFNTEQVSTVFGIGNQSGYGLPKTIPNTQRVAYAIHNMWAQTGEIFWMTAKSLTGLFTGQVGFDQMGGPIFIYEVASKAGEEGWDYFFRVLCWLSISLGLVNLIPIPLLDGGHLLFLLIEGIKRRPVSLRTRQIAAYVGFSMIILLMLLVMKNDISRAFFG